MWMDVLFLASVFLGFALPALGYDPAANSRTDDEDDDTAESDTADTARIDATFVGTDDEDINDLAKEGADFTYDFGAENEEEDDAPAVLAPAAETADLVSLDAGESVTIAFDDAGDLNLHLVQTGDVLDAFLSADPDTAGDDAVHMARIDLTHWSGNITDDDAETDEPTLSFAMSVTSFTQA